MDFVIQGVNAALSLYLAYWMYSSFGSSKYNRTITISVFTAVTLLYTGVLVFINNAILGYFSIFVLTLSISILQKMRTLDRMIYAAIYYVLSAAAEMIVAFLLTEFFDLDFNGAKEGILYITGMLISKFVIFFIVILIRSKHHIQLLSILKKNNWSILTFPVSTFGIILLQHSIFIANPIQSNATTIFVIVCYTLVIISNVIIFEYIDTLYKNTMNESKLETATDIIQKQTEQYNALIQHNNDIRKLRHNHRNFCIGVLTELKNGNINTAINAITAEYNLTHELVERPNDIIHTIIDIKKDMARKDNIDLDFEYHELHRLAISSVDIAIILGNALDNAIEATRSVVNQSRQISVLVAIKHQNIVIVIKNPVNEIVKVNDLKTRKQDPEYHGFGILSMKQIAAKHRGEIVFTSENGIFTATIIMSNIEQLINE